MAVARISDTDKTDQASAASVTTSSITVSGTNPAILLAVALFGSGNSVSSVVLNTGLSGGTPYLVKKLQDGTCNIEVWAVPAPSGAGTITVNYSSNNVSQVNAILVSGADQTTPAPTADAASLQGSLDSSLTVTPSNLTANDLVYYIVSNANGGDAPNCNTGTQIMFGNSTSINAAVGWRAGTGSVTGSWGSSASDEGIVAVRIKEAPSGFAAALTATGSLSTTQEIKVTAALTATGSISTVHKLQVTAALSASGATTTEQGVAASGGTRTTTASLSTAQGVASAAALSASGSEGTAQGVAAGAGLSAGGGTTTGITGDSDAQLLVTATLTTVHALGTSAALSASGSLATVHALRVGAVLSSVASQAQGVAVGAASAITTSAGQTRSQAVEAAVAITTAASTVASGTAPIVAALVTTASMVTSHAISASAALTTHAGIFVSGAHPTVQAVAAAIGRPRIRHLLAVIKAIQPRHASARISRSDDE